MAHTLTALSQRTEAFWVGLVLFLLGVSIPAAISLGGIGLSRILIFLGGSILLIRLLVGSLRILQTTAKAGIIGYREGQNNDK